jgi:hypothetical protein
LKQTCGCHHEKGVDAKINDRPDEYQVKQCKKMFVHVIDRFECVRRYERPLSVSAEYF